MSHARLRVCGQEIWHHNVVRASGRGDYLTLELDAHPSRVHYWLGGNDTTALLCADAAEVTRALRAEHPERDYSGYCSCGVLDNPECPIHGEGCDD